MSTPTDRFTLGYQSAVQFYGRGARYALDRIAGEVARFRDEFPKLPVQVEPYIARIERFAHQDDHLRGHAEQYDAQTAPEGLAAIRAALATHADDILTELAATLAYLGSKPEWSMEDNYQTTEWIAALAARHGLPSAGDQTPAALAFYRAAAREAGYDVDEESDDARC